jgi:PAS domain S-box-containing protein
MFVVGFLVIFNLCALAYCIVARSPSFELFGWATAAGGAVYAVLRQTSLQSKATLNSCRHRENEEITWDGLFEKSVDPMFVFDERGIVQAINPTAAALSGFHISELNDQSARLVFPDVDFHAEDISGTRFRLKDGEFLSVDLHITRANRNQRTVFVATLRDMFARLRAERTEVQLKLQAKHTAAITHEVGRCQTRSSLFRPFHCR